MLRNVVIALVMCAASFTVAAQSKKSNRPVASPLFDAQVALVTEKAEMCLLTKSGRSGHCKDFDAYQKALFKGSTSVWVEYHMDHVHSGNHQTVLAMLRKTNEAMSLMLEAAKD